MAVNYQNKIVTDGLVLCLDAGDPKSYAGSGNNWKDRSGNSFDFTNEDGFSANFNSEGYFALESPDGTNYNNTITNNTTCTFVIWIRTTEVQALFWHGQSGSQYLGAYRGANKEYYGDCGSPDFYMDTVEKSNIYDHIRDGEWHMVEFKNVNFANWTNNRFNNYGTYDFGDGAVGKILIYNRNLTAAESTQNFNALKGRFGI